MKGILLSLLVASSLTSLPTRALADRVYIQAGPVGLSVRPYNNNYPIRPRPDRYIRRDEYVERREFRPDRYIRRDEYVERREFRPHRYIQRDEFRRVNDYNRGSYFRY